MAFETESPRRLTADDIWAATDIKEKDVSVPEWNGTVRIRGLTLDQINRVAGLSTHRDPRTQVETQDRALLAAHTLIEGIVDPKLTIADVGRLRLKSAVAVTRVVQEISSLGATEATVAEADKSNGHQPAAALSVFPGASTPHDGGPDAAGDDRT